MKFTNEIIDQIDDNNMKAMEIIRTIMCLVGPMSRFSTN